MPERKQGKKKKKNEEVEIAKRTNTRIKGTKE